MKKPHVKIRRIVIESNIKYLSGPPYRQMIEPLGISRRLINVYTGKRILPARVIWNLGSDILTRYEHPDRDRCYLDDEYRAPDWLMTELEIMIDRGRLDANTREQEL